MPTIAAMWFVKLAILGSCMLAIGVIFQPQAMAGQQIERSFVVDDIDQPRRVTAHIYVPERLPANPRILVVMHGVRRAAGEYLNDWKHIADTRGVVLLAPEFSRKEWPENRHYSQGNIIAPDQESLRPVTAWSFTAMEKAVEVTARLTGADGSQFFLYGHSAGAQFAHRYVMVTGGNRVLRAVAANSGWYMWPDEKIAFPYGTGRLQGHPWDWHSIFGTELTILVGADDSDPNAENLRRTPKAMAQGGQRLERGLNFFAAARTSASKLGQTFRWRLVTVSGVAHSNRDMSHEAARVLFTQ